ncbi:MAG: acyltransferase [Acidobacteria bacterium]|nr:acyltransferase [Acidobacteriota bacterium]
MITSIISRDIDEKRFSVLDFYERRVRRIFPALFVVGVSAIAVGVLVLTPIRLKDFSQSVAATALFTSNFLFWKESGYFARVSETKPLLHTWSLSVEEQFYIVFPLMLWLLKTHFRSRLLASVWFLTIVSFVANLVSTANSPAAAFFLPFGRGWELLLGSLLALGAFAGPKSRSANQVLATIGFALILWSVAFYSIRTPFPGVAALPPLSRCRAADHDRRA